MIKNERQYGVTRAEIGRFEKALAEFTVAHGAQPSDPIRNAQREALESQLEDLREDVRAYEALKAGASALGVERPLGDVSKALIEARIALGLTQRQLAERLEIQEQQIQRYEDTDYSSASLDRVLEVADALEPIKFTIQVQDPRTQRVAPDVYGVSMQFVQLDPQFSRSGLAVFMPYAKTNVDFGYEAMRYEYRVTPTQLVGIGAVGTAYLTMPMAGGNYIVDPLALGHFSTVTPERDRPVKATKDLEILKQTAAA
jgi:ribosome-binding protein aMBF1 (putative translation factor)